MLQVMKKNKISPFTEDWLPVKDIKDGMILTTNKMLVSGVKIIPRNIFILDNDMQNHVLISLKNFYNMLDFEFWLVVSDRPVDISVYMSQLQLLYNKAKSPAIRKLIDQDIEKGKSFINNNVVDTEYFILFKEKNPEEVQKKIRMMINGLASCGLNASPVTDEDLKVILNNFLNGGKETGFGVVMPV